MSLKDKLRSGQVAIGSWVMMRDPISVEVMASGGLDWLAVDMEHSPISLDIAADLIRVGALCGIDMLVRMPDHNLTTIKQVLDAGASGVIVPDVRTVDDAQRLINAIRYPKTANSLSGLTGHRGSGLARAQGYGRDFKKYFGSWNSKAVFIPQIEHIDAVPNAQAIASLDGVDALFVGPYDLSASMGQAGSLDDAAVLSAVQEVVAAAKIAGKSAGFHCVPVEIEPALARLANGLTLIAYSADVFFIRHQVDLFVSEVRKRFP